MSTSDVSTSLGRLIAPDAGWFFSLYPDAGEGGGGFRSSYRPNRAFVAKGFAADPERAAAEVGRRAGSKLRRYCAANRLNRLGTLTYAGTGCHDPKELRAHLGAFFRDLRTGLGGSPLPYAWVPEWHKTEHGLHAHFAFGQYIKQRLIRDAWGRGHVHIKLIGDLRWVPGHCQRHGRLPVICRSTSRSRSPIRDRASSGFTDVSAGRKVSHFVG